MCVCVCVCIHISYEYIKHLHKYQQIKKLTNMILLYLIFPKFCVNSVVDFQSHISQFNKLLTINSYSTKFILNLICLI